ncbi:HSF-type DNA-binding-domain-containing protein [Phycomyces nitens]|nr:HSF-type DNA-binding-domain-containing protein [Phycomyces nitens]
MDHRRLESTSSPGIGHYNMLETTPSQSPFLSPFTLEQLAGQSSATQAQKPAHTNTFVHKLYNMVVDTQYQHLIAWNYTGSSFIVCNIMEFSRDVLPKHFKHNNFSSFVRQLNMYGFHKVNKSPRGHRTLAENQIWEFSHPKFLRNRADLLDDIKRKAMETDPIRREGSDLQAHMAMMQMSQSDMMQQIGHLFENFQQVVRELSDAKRKQAQQQQMLKAMMQYISNQNGGQAPPELSFDQLEETKAQERPPSIFVTSHDPSAGQTAMQDLSPLGPQTTPNIWAQFTSQP